MSGYPHADVADGIAAVLKHGSNAFTEVGQRAYGSQCTVFTVTLDSGREFTVTVEEVPQT